jgi:hypothetical protein
VASYTRLAQIRALASQVFDKESEAMAGAAA